jgi:hypothetical protein
MPPLKYQTPSSYIGKKPAPPKPPPRLTAPTWSIPQKYFTGGFGSVGGQGGVAGPYTQQAGQAAMDAGGWQQPQYEAPRGRMVTPDYSGILGAFTSDARARFGAGLEAMKAQRLSGARSAINKLGVRDVPGLLEKVKQYGLTQADLQGAADNPWSELKALDQIKAQQWQNAVAGLGARGGFRSGATIGQRENIDQTAAREEARLTQQTLEDLGQGLNQQTNWEREQRDAMEQAIANQQAQLAAAYQPYWQWD